MTQQNQQPTAKIYAFPKRPRERSDNPHNARDPRFDAVEFGTGWYHQAAVEDAVEDVSVSGRKH